MARWVETKRFRKSLGKLSPEHQKKTKTALKKLSEDPPRSSLRLRPMEGHKDLWEARVDSGFRMILRLASDADGDLFHVEDVGPHDVYRSWDKRR